MRGNRGELIAEGVTIQLLAVNLSGMLGRLVLDRTGLNGRYDFKLEWAQDPGGMKGPGSAGEKAEEAGASDLSGPSIFTALQEQLGLKLESTKGPVEIIVIDRVENPPRTEAGEKGYPHDPDPGKPSLAIDLFAAVAGLLTLALRNNHARTRHWIWLTASVKFLIPFALLVGIGSHWDGGPLPQALRCPW